MLMSWGRVGGRAWCEWVQMLLPVDFSHVDVVFRSRGPVVRGILWGGDVWVELGGLVADWVDVSWGRTWIHWFLCIFCDSGSLVQSLFLLGIKVFEFASARLLVRRRCCRWRSERQRFPIKIYLYFPNHRALPLKDAVLGHIICI